MILRSSSSVWRAGATGPRSEPLAGIRRGRTSSLRIARDSYHSAAHFANTFVRERCFARESAECAMRAFDRAKRLIAGITEHRTVAHSEQLRLERPQRAGRLEVALLVPGRHRGEREREREVARHGGSAERREHVTGDQRAVPCVEEGDVARRVAGGLDHLEAADAGAGLEEYVGL